MIGIPKPTKLKSNKIRQSARGKNCTLRIPGICNHDSNTVTLCHLNSNSKGVGNKSHDIHAVYACSSCHDWLDGRLTDSSLPQVPKKGSEALRALLETQDIMIQEGLIKV